MSGKNLKFFSREFISTSFLLHQLSPGEVLTKDELQNGVDVANEIAAGYQKSTHILHVTYVRKREYIDYKESLNIQKLFLCVTILNQIKITFQQRKEETLSKINSKFYTSNI